jgi:hypothetical protein
MTVIEMSGIEDEVAGVSRHRYPAAAMVGDYLRAAAGLVPALALFASVPLGAVPAAVLGGFAAIFGAFGLRTALRHNTRLEMDDTVLRAHGLRVNTLSWAELDRLRLAYYSTRRDRKSGWMQLELGAGAARISVDSRIGGFDRLVRRAAVAADFRGIALSDATVANLAALGIRMPEHGPER